MSKNYFNTLNLREQLDRANGVLATIDDVDVDAFAGDGAAPMLAARINVIVEYQTSGALA